MNKKSTKKPQFYYNASLPNIHSLVSQKFSHNGLNNQRFLRNKQFVRKEDTANFNNRNTDLAKDSLKENNDYYLRMSNVLNINNESEGLKTNKNIKKEKGLTRQKLKPLQSIHSFPSIKKDAQENVLITALKEDTQPKHTRRQYGNPLHVESLKLTKNKNLRTTTADNKKEKRIIKRRESAKLTKVTLDALKELLPMKVKGVKNLEIKKKPVKYYNGMSERLQEYKKRHSKMVVMVEEFKRCFDERQFEKINKKSEEEFELYLDSIKGTVNRFKKERALRMMEYMIDRGKVKEIKKYIQMEFEAKGRKKKRFDITHKKTDLMKDIKKTIEVLDLTEKEYQKRINKKLYLT